MAWLTANKLRLTARHDGGRLVSDRRANVRVGRFDWLAGLHVTQNSLG